MYRSRTARLHRKTSETEIDLELNLDGTGSSRVDTGVGFFDHMLTAFSRHGLFDLTITCRGDLEVDSHHTVEDIGICLGQAFSGALSDKTGITRFGSAYVPMDESLVRACVDLSGRAYLVYRAEFQDESIGSFPSGLCEEFWKAFSDHARMNLHVDLLKGANAHHGVEAIFKAVARALRDACGLDARVGGVPSTKGVL